MANPSMEDFLRVLDIMRSGDASISQADRKKAEQTYNQFKQHSASARARLAPKPVGPNWSS